MRELFHHAAYVRYWAAGIVAVAGTQMLALSALLVPTSLPARSAELSSPGTQASIIVGAGRVGHVRHQSGVGLAAHEALA